MQRAPSLVLTLGLTLFVLAAMRCPARAQDTNAILTVCNKGTVAVQTVATFQTGLFAQLWEIEGTSIAPGACEIVYDGTGERQQVFLGFGLKNSRGQFVSGTVPAIPDFGYTRYDNLASAAIEGATERRTLQRLTGKAVCVHADRTLWGTTDGTFPTAENCAQFQLGGTHDPGTGSFYPLTLALDFRPSGQKCRFDSTAGVTTGGCAGGDHHMNVVANAVTGVVTVTQGIADGGQSPEATRLQAAAKEAEQKLQAAFLEQLAAAYDQSEQRKAAAAAAQDPMAQADANRRAFETRQSQINYAAEHTRNLRRVRDLAEFTPQWLTSPELLYVRGTVSRVELSPDGRKPARLYFTESPSGAFVACLSPLFFSNADVKGFVGQRLEVRGRVAQSRCGATVADIQVMAPSMIHNLADGTPPDEAILPGMTVPPEARNAASAPAARPAAANPAIVPADGAAIPVTTRLRVTLRTDVDMLHAKDQATFQASLASPVTLPDGAIPQGAGIILICHPSTNRQASASMTLHVYSVSAGGKIWQVSTDSGTPADGSTAASLFRGGTTVVFTVNSSKTPVTVRR